MKIVEYSKGSITEVENVFKVVESGAQGPPGTIGTLDQLDNKPVVVAADLALTGDSASSFANKNSTWQQIIDSVLSGLYLKRSANDFASFDQKTTIADGDHVLIEDSEDSFIKKWILKSLLGGGGGGAEWTETARVVVLADTDTVSVPDCFSDTYDIYRVRIPILLAPGSTTTAEFRLGYGAGPTWVTTGYAFHVSRPTSNSGSYFATSSTSFSRVKFIEFMNSVGSADVKIRFSNLRTTGAEKIGRVVSNSNRGAIAQYGSGGWKSDETANKIDHFQLYMPGLVAAGTTIIVEGKNV